MKPFDLDAAKRGEPLWMDALHTGWAYQGPVFFVGVSGNDLPVVEIRSKPHRVALEYLSMAPKKRTVFVNIWEGELPRGSTWSDAGMAPQGAHAAHWFDTEQLARNAAHCNLVKGPSPYCIAVAVPIEIEE